MITINSSELKKFLQHADFCIQKNHNLPPLRYCLMTVKDDVVKISATDLSTALSLFLKNIVKSNNEIVLFESKPLIQFLQTLEEKDTVSIEKKNQTLVCISGRKKIILNIYSEEEYPLFSKNSGDSVMISSEILVNGFESVIHAVSQSQIKPEINCVKVFLKDETIVFAATDTFRLAQKKISFSSDKNIDIQIPEKSALQIISLLKDFPSMVSVVYNENQISFETPYFYFTSRLIEGKFPNYEQIIPKQNTDTTVIPIPTNEFLKNIKTAMTFSDETHTVFLKKEKDFVEIHSENKTIGSYTTTIPIKTSEENILIKCNLKYLIDAVSKIKSDIFTISITSPQKPFVIKPQNDNSLVYIIMPINK